MSRRVLVTGGGGFLGRPIAEALRRAGCEVITAGRSMTGPGQSHLSVDLLQPGAAAALLRRTPVDIVVHAAWYVEHGRFWTAPDNLDWVGASLALARAGAEAGVARFVGLGTCAEYDWSVDRQLFRESDPLAPESLYGEAKASTFRLCQRFLAQGPTGFAWARIFHPFGACEPAAKLVPSLASALRRGLSPEVRSGPLLRDFIAAPDVGEAVAALALSVVEGAVNVGTGRPVSVRDLAETLADCVGGGARPVFSDRPPSGEPLRLVADVTRLRQEVGVPEPPPLAQRLSEALSPGQS